MKNKLIVCLMCIVALVAIFAIASSLPNDKPRIVQYDTNAADSPHYTIGDKIKVGKADFIIIGYDLSKDENNLKIYNLELEINDEDYRILENGYTFMLADHDTLIKKTNCSYENNTIKVVEIKKSSVENPNQIVIIENESFEILATVSLNE